MKQLFLLSIILALSIELYGQKISNKMLLKDLVETSEGYEVIGTSEPMPNNGVERHMMAVYRALSKYAPRADSLISGYAVISGNSSSSNSKIACYIDYTILQNFVDEIGREHVLLRITSGNHLFITQKQQKRRVMGIADSLNHTNLSIFFLLSIIL